MKFERINTGDKETYWHRINEEFALAAEYFSNYLKKIGQDKKAEEIIHDWSQELMDWRANIGDKPVQDIEKDIADLKSLLTAKAENDLLSEYATADSCYYDHLLLLSLGTSELHKNPEIQYKKDEEVDKEDILDVAVNEGRKESFYKEAIKYLSNSHEYNRNESSTKYNLETRELDADALVVLNKLSVLDSFYRDRAYYNFKTLPSFVADKMIENKQQNDLYYSAIFPKFESFSNLVAKDLFNNGVDDVVAKFLHHFDRFPETNPLWALDKILKCRRHSSSNENLMLEFINKYIKSPSELKEAYQLILRYGIKIEDEKISHSLSAEDKQEYQKVRDEFVSDITLVLGDNNDNYSHEYIKDSEKFYEMAEDGYGPLLLQRTTNYSVDFDTKLLIEKLKRNRQSYYILRRFDFRPEISPDTFEDIINEGDMDVLAAYISRVYDIGEEAIIKLWENGYQQAVKTYIRKSSDLSDKILQLLIDSGEDSVILSNLDNFKPSTETLKGLIDNFGERLADGDINLKYFEHCGLLDYLLEKVNDAESLDKLTSKGFLNLTVEDKNKFVAAISKAGSLDNFLVYAIKNDCLSGLDFQITGDKLDQFIENNIGEKVTSFFSIIAGIKNKPGDSFYIKNIGLFTKEENQNLTSFFITLSNERVLSRSQEDLGLSFAPNKGLANKLIEAGKINLLVDNLIKFKGLNQEIALKLIEAKKPSSLIDNIERFDDLSRDFGYELISLSRDFLQIVKVNEYFNPPLDKLVAKTSEIFGAFANVDNYNIIKGVNGNDRETIKKLRLKKGGNDGLRELWERFAKFKQQIIAENFNPEVLLQEDNSSLYLSYFQSYVRLKEAKWGNSDDKNFKNIINNHLGYKNKGELKELNRNFTPSQELLVATSDIEAREDHRFNEHFLNRFSVLVNSIKNAKNLYQEKFPLSKLLENIEEKKLKLIEGLREKLDDMPNPRAKEGVSQKISSLESVNVRDIKGFQDNFSILARNNEFNELLRRVTFLISFSKNKQSLDFDLEDIDLGKPKLNDISWVLDFVDHITNQETMSKYFPDKKAKKMFDEIISAKAISDEMALLQNMGGQAKDVSKIQLIPTRGLLTEFSGHIADACWASKYNSILKEFPNFTSVIIRQNPETKHERLAGAFMLIETESKNGERLLVIRGLNPIENLINSLSVKDFYKKTTEYLKDLAEKDNRKLAIVIDDHSGGSSTNRPALFAYLQKLSKKLEAIDLKSEDDTTFNNYNIVRQTYLVE